MILKIIGGLLIGGVLISFLGKWIWVPIGIIVLLWLIRMGADIYWNSGDRKW